MDGPTPADAQAALDVVERSHLHVVDQIDLPQWYWWSVALGWIALGVVTDLGNPWLTTAGTLVFGAVHSAVAPRVVHGRHRSNRLSVRAEVTGPHIARLVFGGLILLAAVTIVASVALVADGARHPVTIASVFVAALVVLGGPLLLATVRRRLARTSPEA